MFVMRPKSSKDKVKYFFKEKLNLELSDVEAEEIKLSLYYFAKAKIEYLQQKKGGTNGNK